MITNENIYELLLKMSEKIDHMDKEIQRLKVKTDDFPPIPEITLNIWIEKSVVNYDHVIIMLNHNNGTIEAFKQFIQYNNSNIKLPSFTKKNKLYVPFMYNDEVSWKSLDEVLNYFIQEVWRKFVEFILHTSLQIQTDMLDLYKQQILSMRTKLCAVNKNKQEIIKWLTCTV